MTDHTQVAHCNEVRLIGRLGGQPERRLLPSGDEIVTFRMIVDRPARARRTKGRRSPTVDTLDCAVTAAGLSRRAQKWDIGDVIEVEGELHRRFWRAGAAVASRTEIQVVRARRLRLSA
jgi:single-strand DNA-binding protein